MIQTLWPTEEIRTAFALFISVKLGIILLQSLYNKNKVKHLQVNHDRLAKAKLQMENSTNDKEVSILRAYIRLQEEKIVCNGHSLQEIQNNPALGQKQMDPFNMIVGFGSMQLMKVVMKDRSDVILVLPFKVSSPVDQLIHIGMKGTYENNEVGRMFLNFTLGFVINKIIKKILFGHQVKIPISRTMEIQQLKTQAPQAIELIKLGDFNHFVEVYPDINEATQPNYEDTM
eukprot:EST45314.1 Hypothetical protein SS50377_14891 [Spironucleus salmonicida]